MAAIAAVWHDSDSALGSGPGPCLSHGVSESRCLRPLPGGAAAQTELLSLFKFGCLAGAGRAAANVSLSRAEGQRLSLLLAAVEANAASVESIEGIIELIITN